MSYRMIKAVDTKKLVSYFKKSEKTIVQRIEDGYLVADAFCMFKLGELPQEFNCTVEVGQSVMKRGWASEWGDGAPNCKYLWDGRWKPGVEAHEIQPTNLLMEHTEGVFIRELHNSDGLTAWVNKRFLDVLSTDPENLKDNYFYITTGEKSPICVACKVGGQVAILMPLVTRERIRWE